MFVPGLNGSSLGGELPLDPCFFFCFFFFFFGVVEEGELLDDEWDGFTTCCCELFGPLLFLWHSSWAHWMSSVASCLAVLHTFECCDLCYLEELSMHLRMVRLVYFLCFAVLVVAVASSSYLFACLLHSKQKCSAIN